MSFALSLQSELLKTKRTASFWLSVFGAALIPTIFFLKCVLDPADAADVFKTAPWETYFKIAWGALSIFLLPMYIILTCALIPQIEFKNNAWKQVFASPQSVAQIFFSKFLTVHLMILLCYLLFNALLIAAAVGISAIHPEYTFLNHRIDWVTLMQVNVKSYISILGISAFQFWLSLRFKSFIGPVGIGLALLVASVMAREFHWEHIYKLPHAHPLLTLESMEGKGPIVIENHELNSIGYLLFFMLVGFLDLKFRKEKG